MRALHRVTRCVQFLHALEHRHNSHSATLTKKGKYGANEPVFEQRHSADYRTSLPVPK